GGRGAGVRGALGRSIQNTTPSAIQPPSTMYSQREKASGNNGISFMHSARPATRAPPKPKSARCHPGRPPTPHAYAIQAPSQPTARAKAPTLEIGTSTCFPQQEPNRDNTPTAIILQADV